MADRRPRRRRREDLPVEVVELRSAIVRRIQEVQDVMFGKAGAPEMARSIGVPYRTYLHWIEGIGVVSAHAILQVMVRHGVASRWLHHGEGPMFEPQVRLRGRAG